MSTRNDEQLRERAGLQLATLVMLALTSGCSPDGDAGLATLDTGGSGGSRSFLPDAGGEAGAFGAGASDAGGASAEAGAGSGGPAPCPLFTPEQFCRPSGFPPLVTFAHSSDCSPEAQDCPVLTLEAGALCFEGAAPTQRAAAHFPLIFFPFDAVALEVSQFAFSITGLVPPARVEVETGYTVRNDCGLDVRPCAAEGFFLPPITEDGRTVASMADFEQIDPESPYQTLPDAPAPGALKFHATGGAYDFCLSDFAFLNAEGEVVAIPSEG